MNSVIRLVIATVSLSVSLSLCAKENVTAASVPLPKLELKENGNLQITHNNIRCGSNEYFVDKKGVLILVNGTPVEFNRTCHGKSLKFVPVNQAENQILVDLITSNRNLNFRYKSGLRSYVYNDWQLAPIKEALIHKM